MFSMTFVGGCCLVSGFFLFVFKGVAAFMEKDFPLADLSLEQVLDPESLEWVENLPWEGLQIFADQVLATPLYLHCLVFGVFFLVLGGIRGR
ncbi:hypothetical protein [Desulfobotulus sp.]|jgi:hypothetical protein|uniref:hypothetical protein n=1 Tax=Desulfobotulus sp. TaxID=1940337 RepID=UPI002A35EF9E|nr:hypothetical protein [Desulfobotulus sp.]MDY0163541.1 hypothetical protein [Desulfobotulus sp.]